MTELRARWDTLQGRALALEASRWLAGSRSLPEQIGAHDGRVDLRGLVFPDAQRVGSFQAGDLSFAAIGGFPNFENVRWRGVDLRGAVIRNARFVRAEIDDCVFDEADLFDWRLWNTTVANSSFVRADLRSSALGTDAKSYGGTNSWVGVDFDRADLTGSFFNDAALKSCTFRRAKMRRMRFGYVSFEDVVFEGIVERTVFEARKFDGTRDPGPMRRVDFSGAIFRDVDVSGYRFDEVTFPPDVQVIHDFPRVVVRALDLARGSDDADERAAFHSLEYAADHRSQGTWDGIWVPADSIAAGDEAEAEAISRLYRRALASDPSKLLRRIEAGLVSLQRRVLLRLLQPGLDAHRVRSLLHGSGLPSTEDLEFLYAWRDGTKADGATLGEIYLFPGFYFLSLEDALLNYQAFSADPRWSPGWLPVLADGGGDFYAVDLRSEPFGRVRHFRIDEVEHPVEFASLRDLFETVAAGFERGLFFVDESGYFEMDDLAFGDLAAEINPNVPWWDS